MNDSDPILLFERLYEQEEAAVEAEREDQLGALKKKHDSALIEWLLRIERRIKEKLHHLGVPEHAVDHHILKAFHEVKQEIHNMGTSLSAQLDAVTAAIQADVAAVSAEVSQLLAGVQNQGGTITQAQIDALTAIDASLKAIPAAGTGATGGTGGAAHTAQDTNDGTPNGSARADGTVRNNFFMPGFDANQPETT